MSTETGESKGVEGWTDDEERVISVADVTYILSGQIVGESGPISSCAICDASLEAGDVVSVEAVKQESWHEWAPRLLKCTSCCREELTIDHAYFHQVLVRAMLLRAENVATESSYHALTNVALVDYSPQGDGFYVDPATFEEEIQLRIDTTEI